MSQGRSLQGASEPEFSYHVATIKKGVFGEYTKVVEEAEEFADACQQGNVVMALTELSDLYGAMSAYLSKHHPTIGMQDLGLMAYATERAFRSGRRV